MPQPKILITGAASGIGRAVADLFAAKGYDLVLVDLADHADVASQHSPVQRLRGSVSDESFWSANQSALAGLTHAVVNAGVSSGGPIEALEFDEWRRVMSVNLDGAFLTLRAALRAIKASSGPRSIVITGSISGMKAEAGVAAYGASKAAVLQLAKVAAKEVAPDGIRVNAIAPGGVDTPIWDDMPFFEQLVASEGSREAAISAMAKMATPLGRYASADEIAAQIAFLLSDDAATMTGTVLTSDGGYSL
ncbi:SDR family oxidoreductase [Sphingomonas sp. NSE70-1]|uniref:SDR family oxidoreductase n=1 Tax=Sphingomonas caseinilyticus TaxID=2908205 RepID=A0ABT0RR92_9SPHN|nr:SDR family oxidoreductase [Sphingomonas caseinilyticus]MCL6697343.1 SDR family oxidoreductase [Sphingomonas caseinilyticus]